MTHIYNVAIHKHDNHNRHFYGYTSNLPHSKYTMTTIS